MSPALVAILFAVGIGIFLFSVMPDARPSVFSDPARRRSSREKLLRNLKLAGFEVEAPTFILVGLAGACLAGWMILGALFHNLLVGLFGIPLVLIAAHMALLRRQRQFLLRATNELTPFFNRILTAAKAGRPAAQAYTDAVNEAGELRSVLEDSAARMATGVRFADALETTIPELPLRMWALFVRQLQLHEELGGDLPTAIETTVTQINEMLQLQAEARADYAAQAKQQQIIFVIPFASIAAFSLVVPGGLEMMSVLVTTILGIIGGLFGLSIMAFGLWFGNRQLRAIDQKLSF